MTRLVSSRWLGERGERLLCFPSWGISETKCACIFCFCFCFFFFSRRNLSFMVLCRTMYPLYCGRIDQGLHLSLQKKNECELLGNIHSRKVCTRFGVCLHLDLRLSPFLFSTKSGV